MNRRKFLSLISGAVAAVAGGLGLVKAAVTPEPDVMAEFAANLRANLLDPNAAMLYDEKWIGHCRWKTLDELAAEYNEELLLKLRTHDRRTGFAEQVANVERLFNGQA